MIRVLLTRAVLAAVPFLAWFLWAAWARRTGRPMGSTPWPWLVGVAGVLVGVSLLASGLSHHDNRAERYVPAEAGPDGAIAAGHFEKR